MATQTTDAEQRGTPGRRPSRSDRRSAAPGRPSRRSIRPSLRARIIRIALAAAVALALSAGLSVLTALSDQPVPVAFTGVVVDAGGDPVSETLTVTATVSGEVPAVVRTGRAGRFEVRLDPRAVPEDLAGRVEVLLAITAADGRALGGAVVPLELAASGGDRTPWRTADAGADPSAPPHVTVTLGEATG